MIFIIPLGTCSEAVPVEQRVRNNQTYVILIALIYIASGGRAPRPLASEIHIYTETLSWKILDPPLVLDTSFR